MADVEHRLAYVTAERVQLLALVGAFSEAKEAIVAAAEWWRRSEGTPSRRTTRRD